MGLDCFTNIINTIFALGDFKQKKAIACLFFFVFLFLMYNLLHDVTI